MPVSKLRKKTKAKNKKYRKTTEGRRSVKGLKRDIAKHNKNIKRYMEENKDNIVQPQDFGLGEKITYDDVKDLKQQIAANEIREEENQTMMDNLSDKQLKELLRAERDRMVAERKEAEEEEAANAAEEANIEETDKPGQ